MDTQTTVIPQNEHIKTTTFLPEDIQNLLLYWRDKFKQGYFEIGDIAARVMEQWTKAGVRFNQQEIFNEIGRFCGKSGRTVRYYYETAVFYPPEIRDQYNPLPFSHFVFARSFGDWQAVLDYAMQQPNLSESQVRIHFLGIPGSVSDYNETSDELGARSLAEQGLPPIAVDQSQVKRHRFIQAVSNMRDGLKAIRDMFEYMDEYERRSYEDLLSTLEPAVEYLPKVIQKVK